MRKRLVFGFLVLALLYCAPWTWLRLTHPIVTPDNATPAAAALIFGAVVRNSQISPLHKERLDTGITLWRDGRAQILVVSNQTKAAQIMFEYLMEQGVPENVIELDTAAERTPDTCEFEKALGQDRSLIFVSQRFHLPRIALQCELIGVTGQLVQADDPNRVSPGIITLVRVRSMRFIRESFLIWGALLGTYPD